MAPALWTQTSVKGLLDSFATGSRFPQGRTGDFEPHSHASEQLHGRHRRRRSRFLSFKVKLPRASQAVGVSSLTRLIENVASPGKNGCEIIANRDLEASAGFNDREDGSDWGPACRLPTWIPFLLPSATWSHSFERVRRTKRSYLLLLQDAERNLRCKAVPGSF